MLTQELLLNLEIIIVTLVITSLSANVFFACYGFIKNKQLEHTQFINNMVAFSMIWMIVSVIVVLSYLSMYLESYSQHLHSIYMFGVIVFTLIIISAIDFANKRMLSLLPIVPTSICATLFIILAILFKMPLIIMHNISIIIYAINIIIFSVLTIKSNIKMISSGLVFTFGGIIIVIFNMLLKHWWGLGFSLTIDLALSIMLIYGFLTYYSEVFAANILEKAEGINRKNNQLLAAEEKIYSLAFVDQVTNLKNIYQLKEDIYRIKLSPAFLIMIGIENFKNINNFAGYTNGNQVLHDIADSMKTFLCPSDEIYRFYADKFIIYHSGDQTSCLNMIERILSVFNSTLYCSMSLKPNIGVTEAADPEKNFDSMVKELELAILHTKEANTSYSFYSELLYEKFQDKLKLELDLKKAAEANDWQIYFQPKISLKDNTIVGAESLLRWKGSKITPDIFIPLSEQLGLIHTIGKYIIETVFQHINVLTTLSSEPINISINLSPYQLMEQDFADYVEDAMCRHSITARQVTFEVTESVLIHNLSKVNSTIVKLKSLGFRFSLDDFGTGFSSISYISKLSLDEVKFDRSFTSSLPHDNKNLIILDTFAKMAKKLGISVVIEGIETIEQYECVRDLGCDVFQGYLFSRPVPFDSFARLVTGYTPNGSYLTINQASSLA